MTANLALNFGRRNTGGSWKYTVDLSSMAVEELRFFLSVSWDPDIVSSQGCHIYSYLWSEFTCLCWLQKLVAPNTYSQMVDDVACKQVCNEFFSGSPGFKNKTANDPTHLGMIRINDWSTYVLTISVISSVSQGQCVALELTMIDCEYKTYRYGWVSS